MMRACGLVSASFRKHAPEEIVKAVKAAGLSCIEWGSDVHAPCRDLDRLQKIAALQNAHGITCSSYGTYFRLGETPLGELPDYIAAAKLLGTDILRVWCGNKNAEEYTDAERDALFAACHEAAAVAERHGVTLCLECHNDTHTNTEHGASAVMRAVNSPALRMYWQPNQRRSVEENVAAAEALAPFTVHLHVFHWLPNKKLPLKDGVAVWKRYLAHFPHNTLLLEFMPDDRIESLATEAAVLKEFIAAGTNI